MSKEDEHAGGLWFFCNCDECVARRGLMSKAKYDVIVRAKKLRKFRELDTRVDNRKPEGFQSQRKG
jgi:hypothetical protein